MLRRSAFILVAIFSILTIATQSAFAVSLTINTSTAFSSLDNSIDDADPTAGVFQFNGDMIFSGAGSIVFTNDGVPLVPNASSPSISLIISGNLEMFAGSGIFAENNRLAGDGGDISIDVGGNMLLHGTSGNDAGAIISSAKTSIGGDGNGGQIDINVGGDFAMEQGTIVSAYTTGGGTAGDIKIQSAGNVFIDGLISAAGSNDVQATKNNPNGNVVAPGDTKQEGGKITVISTDQQPTDDAGVVIGTNGVLVSEGQDPASDTIEIQACGIEINGLVASVSKKSNGSDGNSPTVNLISGKGVTINGSDLGGAGPNQGQVRADYVFGEAQVPNGVNIFAQADISITGPEVGEIFAVQAFGGTSTNQTGGTIHAISMEGDVALADNAMMANSTASGGKGGEIIIDAFGNVVMQDADLQAIGASAGTGAAGGKITITSFNGSLTGDAPSALNASGGGPVGVIKLLGNTVNYLGSSNPAFSTGLPIGAGPVLPQGRDLPQCCAVPEPATVLLLSGGLVGLARRRRRA